MGPPVWRVGGTAGPGLWHGPPVPRNCAGGTVQQGDPCSPWLLLFSLSGKEQTQHFIRATNPNKTLGSKTQWFYHRIPAQKTEIVCGQFFESWWWRVVPKQGSLGPWLLVSSNCQVEEKRTSNTCFLLRRRVSQHPILKWETTTLVLNFPFLRPAKSCQWYNSKGFPTLKSCSKYCSFTRKFLSVFRDAKYGTDLWWLHVSKWHEHTTNRCFEVIHTD